MSTFQAHGVYGIYRQPKREALLIQGRSTREVEVERDEASLKQVSRT